MTALARGRTLLRRLIGRSAPAPTEAQLHRIEISLRELRAMLLAQSVPPPALWQNGPRASQKLPDEPVFARSMLCRQAHFETGYFAYWTAQIAHAPAYHRKLWEFIFIAQALYERGLLRPGSKGLGFGVGREPMAALFASRGCEVVATDADAAHAARAGWIETAQHASSLDGLRWPQICDDLQFDRLVRFQSFDMNDAPGNFRDFDFCWSACALEHLGSIENGLAFIRNSLACLRPGGIAVHTTEFNLHSDDATIDKAETVLFRRRDLVELFAELEAEGHLCAPLDLTEGHEPIERYIDLPPFRPMPHLKMALQGMPATSIGLIIHRRAQ
jgi:SAM-dependent methyltransferase